MVKVYTANYSYDHSLPLVSLAYFLRYPNPYSRHVVSTDVISRSFDPVSGRLTTTRVHLKRSKLPSAIMKLLPKSIVGASANGDSQSYILETSVIDINEGWMKTESRNLEWTGVLSVIERQEYRRAPADALSPPVTARPVSPPSSSSSSTSPATPSRFPLPPDCLYGETNVTTTITLKSMFGEARRRRAAAKAAAAAEAAANPQPEEQSSQSIGGFFRSWSTSSIQRSIEIIGLKGTLKSQPNATEGMKVVLERLRQGGLVAVLEGMRRDREACAVNAGQQR